MGFTYRGKLDSPGEDGRKIPSWFWQGEEKSNLCEMIPGSFPKQKPIALRGKDISWYLPQMEEECSSHFSQAPLALLSYLGQKSMINKGQSFTYEIDCEYCSQEESRDRGKIHVTGEMFVKVITMRHRTTKTLRFKQNIIKCSLPTYLRHKALV